MKSIVEKLLALKAERSTLKKTEMLKEYVKNETFLAVVELTLDETLQYNVKKLPEINPNEKFKDPSFEELCDYLFFLSEKQGASKSEKERLACFCIDNDWEFIINTIISKNLGCGVAAQLVNEALPGTITIIPYQRCSDVKKAKNIVYPAFYQNKEDGEFGNVFISKVNKSAKFITRKGNELLFPENHLINAFLQIPDLPDHTLTYMGEFRIMINGKWMSRKKSNGLVNKALKKNQTMYVGDSERVHFICWNVVTEKEFWACDSNSEYHENLEKIKSMIGVSEYLHVSETIEVNSFKEAQDLALSAIADGDEGGVLKNKQTKWKNGTSTQLIKMKAGSIYIDGEKTRECELKVIGIYYGKPGKKYEYCLGGLECESSCNGLLVNVGGGFTDEDRGLIGWDKNGDAIIRPDIKEYLEEKYMDEVVTVKFNEVITKDNRSQKSLMSPRYIEVREKKDADTLEYIENLGA